MCRQEGCYAGFSSCLGVVLSSRQLKNLLALFAPPTPRFWRDYCVDLFEKWFHGEIEPVDWHPARVSCSLVDGNQCYVLTHVCLDCMEFQSSFFNSRERPSWSMSVRV
ncbi:hypothetical protein QQF64_016038 [Cirrhinus molitorella]|uniref:Uncharacterized protein n=1 Tax=Cirrhinus molitorella TaxID=172907 RepID=A0ABR3LQ15_9TELE